MDKHKQFTETVHPIGSTIDPAPPGDGKPKGKFKFSEADLSSDFDSSIDPPAAEAPLVEPEVVTPPDDTPIAAPKSTPLVVPLATGTTGGSIAKSAGKPGQRAKAMLSRRPVLIGAVVAGVALLVIGGLLIGKRMKPPVQVISDTSKVDKTTLYIDTSKQTVGIKAPNNPDGLQVGATVTTTPQGAANIRLGLVNGTDPSVLFEDNQKNSWQVLGAGGSLQFIQGTQARAKLDDKALSLTNALNVGSDANVAGNTTLTGNLNVNGSTTLGKDGGSLLTIQAAKLSIPNSLNIDDNTLFIDAAKGAIAVGAGNTNGYRLYVAGTIKSNSNIYADGQILAGAGSAKNPSFSFNNNTNTGLFEPSLNAVGIAAGGSQVLQVQQGIVYTVNGANIEAEGYLRGGRGGSNPAFQIARYTGTLDGSGSALISDGMPTGYARVLSIQGFYRGNSNEALPLNIDYVNSGNFQVSGGIPGRQYRIAMIYSQDTAGW